MKKNKKGDRRMPKKIIIGFQTSEEFKKRVVKACKNYEYDGVAITLSMFCRIAVSKLLNKIECTEMKGVDNVS